MSTTVAEKELHSRRQTIREIRSGGMNGRRFLFFSAPLDDTTFLERAAGHARPFLERRTAETPKRNIKSKTTTTTKETGYFLIDFHYRRRRKRNLPELERNEFKSGSMKKNKEPFSFFSLIRFPLSFKEDRRLLLIGDWSHGATNQRPGNQLGGSCSKMRHASAPQNQRKTEKKQTK